MGLATLFRAKTTLPKSFYNSVPYASDFVTGDYRSILSIPGAWRAANLVADTLASFPYHGYITKPDGVTERVDLEILDQPAPPDTRVTTFTSWALDYLLHGNAIGIIADRKDDGTPVSCVPIPAMGADIRRDRDGLVKYRVGGLTLDTYDVIHFKGLCQPGSLRGTGIIENHLAAIELSSALGKQASSVNDHAVPTGVLKVNDPDMTQADADDLKAGWRRSQQTRSIAVINDSCDFTPLSWNPTDTQLLESRKFDLNTWALIFGIPGSFLGADINTRTYNNAETESLNLIKFSIGGHVARFEQELSRHFRPGIWVKANTDALLRSTTVERYTAHNMGIHGGWLLPSEVRALEDLPPAPGLDSNANT